MSEVTILLIVLIAILGISGLFLWRWIKHYSPPLAYDELQNDAVAGHQTDPKPSPVVLGLPLQRDTPWLLSSYGKVGSIFFGAALIIYLLTRFIGLTRFPITFFADEAAQTVLAAELVQNGFSHEGIFLPTYFLNVDKYSLSLTVYGQVVPYLIFGKSILALRGISVLIGMIGVVAVCLALKHIFRTPYWWSGALLLAISPAWFMHSRTAFEAPVATALYAAFLLSYLFYLYCSPKYFLLSILTGALTFYSYNPARVIMLVTIVLLGLSDFRFHWENRRHILGYWWLILLCVLPYIRFQIIYPFAGVDQLFLLNSYWIKNIPLHEKILQIGNQLLVGLSPTYWFFPNQIDLIRHVMKGYGHLLWATLPFALIGIYMSFKQIRISAYRVLLITLVGALLGAAIVEISITRALPFIIPVTLLTAIGLSATIERFVRSYRAHIAFSLSLWIVLSGLSLLIMNDALTNGALWFRDYGLNGMQYGSPQIFEEIRDVQEKSPDKNFILSPYWANGASMLSRFFMDDLRQLQWGVISDYLAIDFPIDADDIFIMLPHEYDMVLRSEKVKEIRVQRIVNFPDGNPGFYFTNVDLLDSTE
jgi:hypothetical protein